MDHVFIYWDNSNIFHEAITFMEPSRPGLELAPARESASLDLARRRAY